MHLLSALVASTALAVPHDLIGGGEPVVDDPAALEAMLEGKIIPAGPVRWRLDPEASRLYAVVEPDARTLDSPRSHRHAVRANQWEGYLVLAPGGRCDGEVSVPVAAMTIDEQEDREALGIEGEVSRWDRADVLSHMLHAEQLDVVSFPEISFKVDVCEAIRDTDEGAAAPPSGEDAPPPDGWKVEGRLSLHGVTKSIVIELRGRTDGEALSLSGTTHIRQTSFGIEPYFALFGQRRNRDAIKLDLRLVGAPEVEEESEGFAPIRQGPEPEKVFER